ncbi:MAG TPA: aldo/keto reductase [Burkholderiaceae bacterium]|nr:aldo/keto reductase [Burkholderiaceae bacterium]
MRYRALGSSGLRVSTLVLGSDNFANPTPAAESERIIAAALDAGVNMIDTANSYAAGAAEELVGMALRKLGRDDVLVATKFHYPFGAGVHDRGNSRLAVIRACEGSLRRLGRDHIDLYQSHRPDMDVPLDETLRALDDLVRAGKVRYIGSSTAPGWHVATSVMTSERLGIARVVSEQSPYNLLDRRIENELLPACQAHGVGVMAWSPLAMGMLAGRYAQGRGGDTRAAVRGGIYAERVTDAGIRVGNAFAELARRHGLDPAQAAYAWVIAQPGIASAIIGPKTLAQVTSALPAAALTLPDTLLSGADALVAPGSAVASFFNSAPWMRWKHL